jgi:hypothetical protein
MDRVRLDGIFIQQGFFPCSFSSASVHFFDIGQFDPDIGVMKNSGSPFAGSSAFCLYRSDPLNFLFVDMEEQFLIHLWHFFLLIHEIMVLGLLGLTRTPAR